MSPRKKLIVLSHPAQFRAAREVLSAAEKPDILCDDARAHDFLRGERVHFSVLDDFYIQDKWDSVNAWGCQKAAEWIRFCKERDLFKEYDLASVLYYPLSRLLIQALKNYHFADKALRIHDPQTVFLFESKRWPVFPAYSSNYLLNYFLADLSAKQGRQTVVFPVDLEAKLPSHPGRAYPRSLQAIFSLIKRLAARAFAGRPLGAEPSILVWGSLNHLGPVVRELKRKGARPVLAGAEFNFERWRFAFASNVRYRLAPFNSPDEAAAAKLAEECSGQVQRALTEAARQGLFVAEGHDFSPLIQNYFFASPEPFFRRMAIQEQAYKRLSGSNRIAALLTENDYAGDGAFLAAFFRSRGTPVFCVSHANVLYDFSVDPAARVFAQSFTLVNSEVEKEMYGRRGWDPEHLIVTGTPRYDRLARTKTSGSRGPKAKRLLYCANTYVRPHRPDEYGYLGSDVYCFKDLIKASTETLLEGLRDLPVELVVKPHSFEGIPAWRRYLKTLQPPVPVRLTKRRANFLEELSRSDGMISYYRSTAAFEAAILGMPQIHIDVKGRTSRILQAMESAGHCRLVHDAAGVREAVSGMGEPRPVKDAYWLGLCDGKNSERVSDFLLSKLAGGPGGDGRS